MLRVEMDIRPPIVHEDKPRSHPRDVVAHGASPSVPRPSPPVVLPQSLSRGVLRRIRQGRQARTAPAALATTFAMTPTIVRGDPPAVAVTPEHVPARELHHRAAGVALAESVELMRDCRLGHVTAAIQEGGEPCLPTELPQAVPDGSLLLLIKRLLWLRPEPEHTIRR